MIFSKYRSSIWFVDSISNDKGVGDYGLMSGSPITTCPASQPRGSAGGPAPTSGKELKSGGTTTK